MDDNHFLAERCLKDLGLEVNPVPPVPGEKRADFIVSDGSDMYVVEVKGPGEDLSFQQQLLQSGEATKVETSGRTNTVSRKIKDAIWQLEATPAPPKAFHLIALVADSIDTDLQEMQYVGTLYGKEQLLLFDSDRLQGPIDCYYFTFNEFFRYPNLDGALIIKSTGSRLLPNTFSPRHCDFQRSWLYGLYNENQAVEDPIIAESQGRAFILDTNLDRHEEKPLLNFLIQKYGLTSSPSVFKPKMISGEISIPPKQNSHQKE